MFATLYIITCVYAVCKMLYTECYFQFIHFRVPKIPVSSVFISSFARTQKAKLWPRTVYLSTHSKYKAKQRQSNISSHPSIRSGGRNALDFFFLITGSNLFLMLSYSVRARWWQTRVAFQREIRLIAAATKLPNSPNPHATVWFSNVRWCVDRCCSFKSDLGECFAPQGRSARCSEQKVLVLKTALIICLVCVFAAKHFHHDSQSGPTVAELTLKISSQS